MFHSSDDDTVPIDSGTPFSSALVLVFGDDLPVVYGSQSIALRAGNVGLDHIFNAYTDRGHNVHEETSSALYADIIPKISDSFFVHLLKPIDHVIMGDSLVCAINDTIIYNTLPNEAFYYDWTIVGGSIIDLDVMSHEVTVSWDLSSSSHKLFLTPYSCNGARGESDSLTISLVPIGQVNNWLGTDGSWLDDQFWSQNHIPLRCESVVFDDQSALINVILPQDMNVFIHSLFVGRNVDFKLLANSELHLLNGQ